MSHYGTHFFNKMSIFRFIVIFIIKGGIFMIVFTLFIGFLCLIYQQDRLYKYLKDKDNNYIL